MPSGEPRRTLFRKYAAYFAGLVSVALLASGLVGLYFAYHESRALIEELQREKVRAVALRIEQFARLIEAQLRAPLLVREAGASENPNELQLELIRLLRQAPAVIDVAWVDGSGVQHVKVSRIGRDETGPGKDWSHEPGFIAARTGAFYASPVYFRGESEPYAIFAVGNESAAASVLLAEVNLKFVWEVVSAIRIGNAGYAYVVDSDGRLVSHPDIGLVLRKMDLSGLPQVRAALASAGDSDGDVTITTASANGLRHASLTAQASIPLLGWHVLVEQPLAEAFEPLYDAALRTAALLVFGLALAVAAALVLARKMSAPIHILKEHATRIGEGRLDERVEISTGDELQALADQFNQMADDLRESYAGLEQKIEERTRELAAANAAKSRFLAIASHDLRQPIHALGLFVAQLKETRSADERERLLGKIEASSESLSELLDALLDISKLDAGAVTAHPAAFDIQFLFNRLDHARFGRCAGEELALSSAPFDAASGDGPAASRTNRQQPRSQRGALHDRGRRAARMSPPWAKSADRGMGYRRWRPGRRARSHLRRVLPSPRAAGRSRQRSGPGTRNRQTPRAVARTRSRGPLDRRTRIAVHDRGAAIRERPTNGGHGDEFVAWANAFRWRAGLGGG